MPKRRQLPKDAGKSLYLKGAWNDETGDFSGITIYPGDDSGVTEEDICTVKQMDLDVRTGDEAHENVKDFAFEAAKKWYAANDNFNRGLEPSIEAPNSDPAEIILGESEQHTSELVQIVHSIVETLPPQQQELAHEVFGLRSKQKDIAAREGVSPQAINARVQRLCSTVKRELAARGITAENLNRYRNSADR